MTARRWMSLVPALLLASPGGLAEEAPACAVEPAFSQLDFWVGEWDVYAGGRRVGGNRITKILDGCAVSEDWTDANGRQGHSLFYFQPGEGTWKQVWVSQQALARGGTKEKTLVERLPGGGLRFQGDVRLSGGGSYLDRTTLTPEAEGGVRQLIEISTDGGLAWQPVFDGRYRRRGQATADVGGAAQPALFLVHFETGPAWDDSRPPAEQPGFAEHSANMRRLREEGLIAFGARYAALGMIVLRAASAEAAQEIVAADPGVRSGIFEFRVDPLGVFYAWRD